MLEIKEASAAVESADAAEKLENHQARLILVFSVAAVFLSILFTFVICG